jgi:hypothetical protein
MAGPITLLPALEAYNYSAVPLVHGRSDLLYG